MKITEIRTMISWAGLRNWVLVKVMTDSGLYGWGAGQPGKGANEPSKPASNSSARCSIVRYPLRREHDLQRLYRHHFWRGGPVGNSAIAALDHARDIAGKAYGVPIYQMLGGAARERVAPLYPCGHLPAGLDDRGCPARCGRWFYGDEDRGMAGQRGLAGKRTNCGFC